MPSKTAQDRTDPSFWREFPDMADYFSPAIVPLLRTFGMDTKQVMYEFGERLGKEAAARMARLSLEQMLDEFSRIWEETRVGRLSIEGRAPLVLQISDCAVCGQLQGTGGMYQCALHEGFFKGALSARLGRDVTITQDTNFEGEAGTWCRRLSTDVSL